MILIVDPAGTVHCLYGEALDLSTLGKVEIARASHLEPDREGLWWADLSPVEGPILGPFARRSEALQAEVRWLEEYLRMLFEY